MAQYGETELVSSTSTRPGISARIKSFVHYGASNSQVSCTHLEIRPSDMTLPWSGSRIGSGFRRRQVAMQLDRPHGHPDWEHR